MYKQNNTIIEESKNEILDAFNKAEREAGEPVDVIYAIDSLTQKDIELWKSDYIKE